MQLKRSPGEAGVSECCGKGGVGGLELSLIELC